MKSALALGLAFAATLAAAQLTPEQMKALRERANQPAPAIDVREFDGRYEASLPERIGTTGPMVTVALECAKGACAFFMGEMRESYPKPGNLRLGLYERTKSSLAKMHPGAQLHGCINLPGDARPDGPFACKLDRNVNGKTAVFIVPPGGDDILTLYRR
jgi:hypothetical protein